MHEYEEMAGAEALNWESIRRAFAAQAAELPADASEVARWNHAEMVRANESRAAMFAPLNGVPLTEPEVLALWAIGRHSRDWSERLGAIFATLNARADQAREEGGQEAIDARQREVLEERWALVEKRKEAIQNDPFAAALEKAADEIRDKFFALAKQRTAAGKVDVCPAFHLLERWTDGTRTLLDRYVRGSEGLVAAELVELYAENTAAIHGGAMDSDEDQELQDARETVRRELREAVRLAEPIAEESRRSYEAYILGDD